MARKQRNSVDYFPHSVTHGKKMFYIRNKYKNDGYAVWFMLLEELGKTEYHYLDLGQQIQKMYLSAEMMVSENLLIDIINDLVKLDEFDRELWDNESILYNEKFVENIKDAYKKRSNECIDKNSLVELLTIKGRIKTLKSNLKTTKSNSKVSENTQSKVKKSKVKNTKVNIPTFNQFKNYALDNKKDINLENLELKYKSWKENDWKDGNGNEIINWKSKLLNTLPYINKEGLSRNERLPDDQVKDILQGNFEKTVTDHFLKLFQTKNVIKSISHCEYLAGDLAKKSGRDMTAAVAILKGTAKTASI